MPHPSPLEVVDRGPRCMIELAKYLRQVKYCSCAGPSFCSFLSDGARRFMSDLMYGGQTNWDTWGSGHIKSREEELETLQELLQG